jgi:thiamine transport system permease protein
MAHSTQPIRRIHFVLGGSAFALLLLLTLGTVIALWWRAEITSSLTPADWSAIRFTILQALLSATVSILVAIPTARALARRSFRGRQFILTLMGAPFILPAIVAVLGILAVWGRSGYISDLLGTIGVGPINIYGFGGVVLAHVFFNIPLATRLLVQGWASIPVEHFRLSAQLGMKTEDVARHLERPMLRSVIPGAFLLIFLLCISSFAVALALGGGPKATTIELAIYQALRFDFDLTKASQLAMIQFALCAAVGALTILIAQPMHFAQGLDRKAERWDGREMRYRVTDTVVLVVVCLFLFLPLVSVFLRGIIPLFSLPGSVWFAAINSVSVAVVSAILSVCMSIAMSALIIRIARRRKTVSQVMEIVGFLTLAASPFVIGTGLFVMTYPFVSPFTIALPVTALVNAAMSLPFSLRVILPAMSRAENHYGRLADSLGMQTWGRFRLAIWPRLRRPVGFSAGLTAALSMGDLGVITLFAAPDIATLPLAMYRMMSSYQLASAAGVALLLVSLSIALFWIFDRGGRLEHNVR